MRHFTRRSPSVLGAGLLVVLAACSDAAPISAPEDAGSTLNHSAAAPGDTARTGVPLTSATAIDLAVTVATAVPGQDSLAHTPLANAKVTIYGQTLVAVPGARADSLKISENVVATATTDASGKARFAALPAAQYRVEAVRDGSGGGSASVTLAPPYSANVAVLLIIRP
jgi:hypothetical protein